MDSFIHNNLSKKPYNRYSGGSKLSLKKMRK